MDSTFIAAPKSRPELNIPESSSTVDVRVIDTGTLIFINPKLFLQPQLESFNGQHVPTYCFLISNGARHVVFDLGVRSDWENYAPRIVSLIKATTEIRPGLDVASVLNLDDSGLRIRSCDITSIIWSHNHFDHIGDPSTFPSTAELVVGPGVTDDSWPGYPRKGEAGVLDSDVQERITREIDFDAGVKIGRFKAFDFFGDGSFYLLDAPGHAVGHMCALARTTATPSSFVFLGADSCHHPGVLRPSQYLPLPRHIALSPSPQPGANVDACLDELLQTLTQGQDPSMPFFKVSSGPLFPDHEAAMDTVRKIQELDAADNIFVLIAHDLSLRDRIPLFPSKINEWRRDNLGLTTRWLFCGDFADALGIGHDPKNR